MEGDETVKKEDYIRQVGRRLELPRKQKQEVLRDLEEIFASGIEHGELEQQVIERLGSPEEYAQSLTPEKRGGWKLLMGCGISWALCLVCLGLFFAARQPWLPQNAIGFAQGSTGIQVQGGINLSPLLLIVAVIALVLGSVFLWRLFQRRKG